MAADLPMTLRELLDDTHWVRRLAHSVARDRAAVDDLAQEACLAALRRPPTDEHNLRGWFTRVLQNLVRQQRRGETRRRRREAAVGPAEPAAAASELVERAMLHRAVVDAVLALDEPLRAPVLLRFFENQPPRAIARRLDVPVATVHTRLSRALAALRRRLDRAGGEGAGWRALAVPMALGSLSTPPLITLLAMKTKTLVAFTAIAIASAVCVLPFLGDGDSVAGSREAIVLPAVAPASAPGHAAETEAPRVATERRKELAPAGEAEPVAEAADAAQVTGRVVDPTGQPLAQVRVRLVDHGGRGVAGPASVASGADGGFRLQRGDGAQRAEVDEPGLQTVLHAVLGPGRVPFALVVAAPAVQLAGSVVGDDGRTIAGARLRVVWPENLRARLSDNADASAPDELATSSADGGAFALRAARVAGAELWTSADGYLPERRPLPQFDDRTLRIVLGAPTARPDAVQGQVVDERGLAIAGAHVGLGRNVARSDASGNFVVEDDARARQLQAAAPGHRLAVLARPNGGFPAFVTLQLGGVPLQIRGRVVDSAGAGVGDARVWLTDATLLADARMPLAAEGIANACITPDELMQQFRAGKIKDPQRTFRQTPTAAWPWTRTSGDGSFVLDGLEDRSYTLRAMDDGTLLRVDVAAVPAGARGVELRLPGHAWFDRIAGRVVDHSGNPVAGVRVGSQCDTVRIGSTNMHAQAEAQTTTADDGTFELRSVPHTTVYLRLDGETILPLEFGRDHAGGLLDLCPDPEHLVVVAAARRHVQVELSVPTEADALRVLDADGGTIMVNVFLGNGRREEDLLELTDGRSPVFVVPDTAATLVLVKGGHEVRRTPMHLLPGDVNRLRP